MLVTLDVILIQLSVHNSAVDRQNMIDLLAPRHSFALMYCDEL